MHTTYPSLSRLDGEAMIRHVGECLSILEGKSTPLTITELRMKTMLTSLLMELQLHVGDLAQVEAMRPKTPLP